MAEENINELRENLLSSLGSMVTPAPIDGTEDFTLMEWELVAQVREAKDYHFYLADRAFVGFMDVAMDERRRQIKNARALDRLTDTARGEEFWR